MPINFFLIKGFSLTDTLNKQSYYQQYQFGILAQEINYSIILIFENNQLFLISYFKIINFSINRDLSPTTGKCQNVNECVKPEPQLP